MKHLNVYAECQEKMSSERRESSCLGMKPNQIKHPVWMKPNLVLKHWFHRLSEGIWPRSKPRLGVHPSLIGADVCFWFFSLLSEQSLCSQTSLSGPASLELPEGWSDRLLVESFHDFSDSWQVAASDDKVALGGTHLVAHLTLLTAEAVALSSGGYSVLSGVQQAPVITISSWKQTH